ncbi:translation initiation factor IF-2 N-terminal domain-containing protein [Corynebacterium kroppenstedtii]
MADESRASRRVSTKRTTKKSSTRRQPSSTRSGVSTREVVTTVDALSAGTKAVIASLNEGDLAPKTRVHQLAKLVGHTSKELIAILGGVGLEVRSAQSTLTREQIAEFRDRITLADHDPGVETPGDDPHEGDTANETSQPEQQDADVRKPQASPSKPEATQGEPVHDRDTASEDGSRAHEHNNPTAHHFDAERESADQGDAQPEKDEETIVETRELGHLAIPTPIFMAPTSVKDDPAGSVEETPELSQPESGERESDNNDSLDSRSSYRRRRGRRGRGKKVIEEASSGSPGDKPSQTETTEDDNKHKSDEPAKIKGSTRAAAARKRREENKRDRHQTISTAEFHARRDAVDRRMIVRDTELADSPGKATHVAIVEDGQLVEHFVASERAQTLVGNIYLGRVQNVLASMEAAFVDIGMERNGVIYSGDVDWRHTRNAGRQRKIEKALKPGDPILVQVTKDPVGHKGPRLTSRISLAGRYLVYVPEGRSQGISRKLPEPERRRLKKAVSGILPDEGGAIIRTAAEGVDTQDIARDVRRQQNVWDAIVDKADALRTLPGAHAGTKNTRKGKNKPRFDGPMTLHEEPKLLVKVVRDLFNEDFDELIVDGDRSWSMVSAYLRRVAPDLEDRLTKYDRDDHNGQDVFAHWGLDKQLKQALDRVVFLPSGGTLVIEKTEAMTVIDVNTGRFTGSGGNLEETVTRNNLEAADEIVRQMRLRDIGGMIVVDFIDMVLKENQELVLRRLSEALEKDRTRHQLGEVTSLGLVQITRKRLGKGLVETFSTPCEECHGRGIIVHDHPIVLSSADDDPDDTDTLTGDNDLPVYSFEEDTTDDVTNSADTDSRDTDDQRNSGRDAATRNRARRSEVDERDESLIPQRRSIEEIAAAAVIVADDEDPDEPSGSDYLPADQRARNHHINGENTSSEDKSSVSDGGPQPRRRRRKATRTARPQRSAQSTPSQKQGRRPGSDDTGDDNAVPSQTRSAANAVDEDKETGATRHGGRRRGRRHATRRMTRSALAEGASYSSPRGSDHGAAPLNSAETTSAVSAAAQQGQGTYEDAQRKFDQSPRRRRATRGNSRSDIPPVKTDYPACSADNVNSAPRTHSTRSGGAEAEQSRSRKAASRQRRGRRRVHRDVSRQ